MTKIVIGSSKEEVSQKDIKVGEFLLSSDNGELYLKCPVPEGPPFYETVWYKFSTNSFITGFIGRGYRVKPNKIRIEHTKDRAEETITPKVCVH